MNTDNDKPRFAVVYATDENYAWQTIVLAKGGDYKPEDVVGGIWWIQL